MRSRILRYGVAAAAAALGAGSAAFFLAGEGLFAAAAGVLLHAAAVLVSWSAARRRRGGPLQPSERDAVLLTAIFIPALGPATAWALPRRNLEEAVENAHEVVERYLEHVKPSIPDYERTLFTGDYERDLARKLDMESYREVLRHGETDQKRSALFRLAELRQPHHLALIRNCLVDEDQEVRLYAYGELDRLTREYEGAIGKGRKLVAEAPEDPESHLVLALAHFDLARSGVFDRSTASFHFRGAAKCAAKAKSLAPDSAPAALLEVRAYAQSGDLDKAKELLEALPPSIAEEAEAWAARAETAFLGRDFEGAREAAGRLILAGADLPGWLQALCVAEEPPPEDPDEPVKGVPATSMPEAVEAAR